MIPSLALLLAFQLAGEVLRPALGLPVPGPVIGMVLLLLMLLACCYFVSFWFNINSRTLFISPQTFPASAAKAPSRS